MQTLGELAQIMMAASERPGLQSITAQAHAYRVYSREQPAMYALLAAMNGSPRVWVADETSARTIGGAMVGALSPLAAAFGRCAHDGLVDDGDSRERAVLLWTAVQGTLQLRKQERVAPEFFDADRLSQTMVGTLLRGWGADTAKVDAALRQTFESGGQS